MKNKTKGNIFSSVYFLMLVTIDINRLEMRFSADYILQFDYVFTTDDTSVEKMPIISINIMVCSQQKKSQKNKNNQQKVSLKMTFSADSLKALVG